MKNKFRLFDRYVFMEMFSQLKLTGLIASAIYLVIGIIVSVGLLVINVANDKYYIAEFDYGNSYILVGLVFVFIPIMLKVVFSYQNKRHASDLFHALPVKKEALYFSSLAAVLVWAILIMVIAIALPLLTATLIPKCEVYYLSVLQGLGNILAMVILVMGGFAIGINLTGTNFTNIAVSVMILLVPRIIIYAISAMVEKFMPFLVLTTGTSITNIAYNMLFGWAINMHSYDIIQLPFSASFVYTLAIGLIYVILGAVTYKCRKSEMASQPTAFKIVQPITRMIPAYLFGLIAVYFFLLLRFRFIWEKGYGDDKTANMYLWGMFSMIILSVIAYLVYELITTRSWKKVAQSAKKLPILGVLIVVTGGITYCGISFALNREVKADKIKYITVSSKWADHWYENSSNVKLVDDKLFEMIETKYRDNVNVFKDEGYYPEMKGLKIGINQGGLTFYRTLFFNSDFEDYIEYVYVHEVNAQKEDFKLPSYGSGEFEFTISGLYSTDFNKETAYNFLKEDLEAGSYRDQINVEDEEVLCYAHINISGDNTIKADMPISKKTPKTYNYIMNEIEAAGDGKIDEFVEMLDSIINAEEPCDTYLGIGPFVCVDGDEVISPCLNVGFSLDKFDYRKLSKLMKQFQNEEGDTLVYFEASLRCNDETEYFEFGKRIPKDLAEEICELMGR